MKILKYILYAIGALVVIFFALGIFKPSISYGHEITVDKPAKITWAVSQDESKFDQWLDGFKSMELISGELGKAGSKYKIVVSPGEGQPDFVLTETLRDIKEFAYIDMHFDNEAMEIVQKVTHTEVDGRTTIKTESTTKAKGMFMRSLFAFMDMFGAFQAQEEKNIEALKKLIEENTTDYYPVLEVSEESEASPEEDGGEDAESEAQ